MSAFCLDKTKQNQQTLGSNCARTIDVTHRRLGSLLVCACSISEVSCSSAITFHRLLVLQKRPRPHSASDYKTEHIVFYFRRDRDNLMQWCCSSAEKREGWAHRLRVSTTFLTGEYSHNFCSCTPPGWVRTLVTDFIESRVRRSTN